MMVQRSLDYIVIEVRGPIWPGGWDGGEDVFVAILGTMLTAYPAEENMHPPTGQDIGLERR